MMYGCLIIVLLLLAAGTIDYVWNRLAMPKLAFLEELLNCRLRSAPRFERSGYWMIKAQGSYRGRQVDYRGRVCGLFPSHSFSLTSSRLARKKRHFIMRTSGLDHSISRSGRRLTCRYMALAGGDSRRLTKERALVMLDMLIDAVEKLEAEGDAEARRETEGQGN